MSEVAQAAAPRGSRHETQRLRQDRGHVGHGVAASDVVGDLIAQTPQGQRARVEVQGLSDIALARSQDARAAPTPTSASRATPTAASTRSGGNRDVRGRSAASAAAVAGGGRGGGGGGGGGGGFGGSAAAAAPAPSGAAGFGVRVIHSGVWGFASSPIVTEDEIRRITRVATEVAKASAIAKRSDVRLAPVPAYTRVLGDADRRRTRARFRRTRSRRWSRRSSTLVVKTKEVTNVNASVQLEHEWKYFAIVRRLVHRAGDVHDVAAVHRHGAQGRRDALAHVHRRADDRRLGSRRSGGDGRERRAHRGRGRRVLHGEAGRHGRQGLDPRRRRTRCSRSTRSSAHATELDRILGYEANYAGTSFVKLSDIGKLKYGSKLFNVTADRTTSRAASARSATTTTA